MLLAWAAETDRSGLLSLDTVPPDIVERFDGAVARRALREPMALILGQTGFWTLDLRVSTDTLIPRADTETLIEALLDSMPDRRRSLRILDLGTGTGCLLLAALSEYPNAFGVGVDVSANAADLARGNAETNGLGDRAFFFAGSWADALKDVQQFDVVLSNPPYIVKSDIPGLMPEVSEHEPMRALDGGEDGLCAYRVIVADLPGLLHSGGVGILEIGQGQGDDVARMGQEAGLDFVALRQDLAGTERALVLRRV